jgi:hypothetical protein
VATKVRHTLVVAHGVGERRSHDALRGFIDAAPPPTPLAADAYRSRPDGVTDSNEARTSGARAQSPMSSPWGVFTGSSAIEAMGSMLC